MLQKSEDSKDVKIWKSLEGLKELYIDQKGQIVTGNQINQV